MKRYLYIFLLLISLSLVIVMCGNLFRENILRTAYTNNDILEFKEYKIDKGRYKVIVPEGWSIQEKLEEGKDFSTILISDSKSINIEIQIYKEKSNFNKEVEFSKCEILSKEINGNEWKVLIYDSKDEERVFYYKEDGKALITMNVAYNQENYKDSIKTIFDKIVGSIEKCI